ncbi:MAG: hypothetical protein ABL971_16465 [Vicinamibacterales bacterium]
MLVLVSTALTLLLVEAGLRAFGIGYGNAPLEASRYLHHVHPRNYQFLMHNPSGEYGGFLVRFDDKGYRVPLGDSNVPRPGARRIAFMGDSFTEGLQMSWAETYVGLIEQYDRSVAVRNFGVASYSPVLYCAQLKGDVLEFKPTDVVLQIYSNDFKDDETYLNKADSQNVHELTRVDGGSSSLAIYLLRYSYVVRLLRKAQLQTKYLIESRNQSSDKAGRGEAAPTPIGGITRRALEEIQRICREHGISLYILMIPSKELVRNGSCCDRDFNYLELQGLSSQLGIEFVDVAPLFAAAARTDRLFFPVDDHLTAEGARVMASAISSKLGLGAVPAPVGN